MRQVNILAVLPYEGMKEAMISAAKERSEIALKAFVGDLDEGVEIVRRQLRITNYDFIISRGGTATLLKESLQNIPLLEIPISFEDIFRSILLALNYREKFAIVSFPVISERVAEVCSLLKYDIEVFTIHSFEEAQILLCNLRERGYTMVVGDMTTANVAKNEHMNAILIMTSRNSIDATLDQAKLVFLERQAFLAEYDRLKWIQKTMPLQFFIFSEDGSVVTTNTDEGELDPKYLTMLQKNLPTLLQSHTGHMELQHGATVYSIDSAIREAEGKRELFVYGRSVYSEKAGKRGGILLAQDVEVNGYAFESPFGPINSAGQIQEAIRRCCEFRLPILILGEPGTGKDAAANCIHHSDPNQNRPYYIIDCALANNKEWNSFFERPISPLSDVNSTIYFKNIHAISPANERKLRELIEHTNFCHRNRVIFSAVVKNGEERCSLVEYILSNTNCFLLQALPIRQRKQDVTSLAILYLGMLNAELGQQIIGFEPGADELMLQYSWPGNVTQLKRVMRELVLCTKGNYIMTAQVEKCIRNEIFASDEEIITNINLDQSLQDITYDVIRMVLLRENMNQKKAAEKLCVSRSTIWRILKSRS